MSQGISKLAPREQEESGSKLLSQEQCEKQMLPTPLPREGTPAPRQEPQPAVQKSNSVSFPGIHCL